jgi:hypothetical protein
MAAQSKIEVNSQSAPTIQQSNNIGEITELARGVRIKRSQILVNVLITHALSSYHQTRKTRKQLDLQAFLSLY